MEKANENASLGCNCLEKRGDGENKEVQLYESFIYDGVKYMLYDCVYMYHGDSREPSVGKLTKIFELSDKTMKVEVRWFFRPEEISKWLGETKTLENEIFLATGEGLGLANINPLDAIICPCNVVCLSKDNRNSQPSDEQRKAADFVFYRTFDVQNYAILDKMDDEVCGLEIKYVFNREQGEKTTTFLESTSSTKEENPNIKKLHDRSLKEIKSDDKCVEAGSARGFEKKMDMPSMKSMVHKVDKGEMKVHILPVEQMENKENIKRKNTTPASSDKLHDQPFKKFKSDNKPSEEKRVATFLESTSGTKEKNPNIKKLHDRSLKEIKSDDKCVEARAARGFEKKMDMPSMKSMVHKVDKGEMKVHIDPVEQMERKENIKRKNKTPTSSDKLHDQPFKKYKSDNKPPEKERVELDVARDSERYKEMSSKNLTVDSKSKHEDKSPADNNLKAFRTCGTTADRKNSMMSAKLKPDRLEGKNLKERRDDGSFRVPDNKMRINSKSGNSLDIRGNKNSYHNKEAKEEQSGECIKKLSVNKSVKMSALSTDEGKENEYLEFFVSLKPNAETNRWFKQAPWEDRLKKAYDQGTAVLLHNVDPEYSSGEVEGIIRCAFKEKCDAKILQQTSVSSPHYAQALILLETKEAAHKVLTKLDKECLMLSHGSHLFMPLVGTPCPPLSTKKNSIFFGHPTIDRLKHKNQREDEAVSSSHYPQENTIEYDLAMDWCSLQLRSTKWWEKFHEQQGLELENLKKNLKKKKSAYSS